MQKGKNIFSHKYSKETGYCQKKFGRKLCEALLIKQNKPALNKQEASVPLKLCN